jgi:hypothetical protein
MNEEVLIKVLQAYVSGCLGDYAFDAGGIVTVSFECEGQGFLVTPLDP